MTTLGRPPHGPRLVERLDLSASAAERLKLILETISGARSVKDASEMLGISETRFHVIRQTALEAAGQSLEPQAPGRPAKAHPESEERIEALEREKGELTVALEAMRLREEIAAIAPHLLVRSDRRFPPRRSLLARAKRTSIGKSGISGS
jgi:predicted ArsR family transcriptional regulator